MSNIVEQRPMPSPETPGSAAPNSPALSPRPDRHRWKGTTKRIIIALLTYFVVAYLLLPALWKRHSRRHPALEGIPRITHTGSGIPGDPLNVALVGDEEDIKRMMLEAKWVPADPLTFRSCLGIAAATVLRRSYEEAPVSNLYLWDRKQDLAFQQPVGNDPRRRHHVRFWRSEKTDDEGRPLWAGAATFDERVGLSRTTGQITHFIDADVDAERDHLMGDLQKTGELAEIVVLEGFHQVRTGKNGGGNPWDTDGNLKIGYLR